jgi:hypothetical protein
MAMSRRPDPPRKTPLDMLNDLLDGHREAVISGPVESAKYLERALAGNKSMPRACQFFAYDLLAEACAALHNNARCMEAVTQARAYLEHAQADAPRQLKAYLPKIRLYERGIGLAVEEGRLDDALVLCDEALALGLGKFYEAKANSIRRAL